MDNIIGYIKNHIVDTLLGSMLVTVLLKDCAAHDILENDIKPDLDSLNHKLETISRKNENMTYSMSHIAKNVNKVTVDLGAIKDKYLHLEKEGMDCVVKQSRFINDNEIGVHPHNRYLKSGTRILLMNISPANTPSMALTVTTDIKVDENDSENTFFLNKNMLSQLGFNIETNRRGLYELRYFNIERSSTTQDEYEDK